MLREKLSERLKGYVANNNLFKEKSKNQKRKLKEKK